jgi:transcription termination/antitermination protein NusA
MAAMAPQATTPLENVPGLGEGLVEKLGAAGITTVEALADMTPEQLEAIEGIGPKTVEKISLAVNNYFASLEGGSADGAVAAESGDAEAGSGEAVPEAEGEVQASAAESQQGSEAAANETEHEPKEGSAPETTE